MYRLNEAGYKAYLVGGGVRDLLLGKKPKDFDVATNATPEQVSKIFKNCRLIGRRFRLAHIHFGREIIEVATFRASNHIDINSQKTDEGMLLRDNVYGNIEEDAIRRDFTVNALYYNIDNFSVIDYVCGIDDLNNEIIRLMGDAEVRYREDPVRMIRAVRFMTKLNFQLEQETENYLFRLGNLIQMVPAARLFDEVLKLFMNGYAAKTFENLYHYKLFKYLFPKTNNCLDNNEGKIKNTFVWQGLYNTDLRIHEEKPVTPAFLFAILLWDPVREKTMIFEQNGLEPNKAMQKAYTMVLDYQLKQISIPKRFSIPMREIWGLQSRFQHTTEKKAIRFISHPRFRAAYDFLLLRTQMGEMQPEIVEWWTNFQDKNANLMQSIKNSRKKKFTRHSLS